MSDEERVEEGLRRENCGLISQRLAAIKDRFPDRRPHLFFERDEPDGFPARARVYFIEGTRV